MAPRAVVVFVLILGGVAHTHHLLKKLLILLLGLWLLYNSAQPNKVSSSPNKPTAPKLLSLFKRSTHFEDRDRHFKVDFNRILQNDPAGCARLVVCHLAAKPRQDLSRQEYNVLLLIRNGYKEDFSRKKFLDAVDLGERTQDESSCRRTYQKCPFTAAEMIKMLRIR